MKIIAIGNSFSQDATHYLHQIAEADGIDIETVNLYIGRCNLERHWNNVKENSKDYLYELNGESTEKYVSIEEALSEERWDYVVLQQASHDSGFWDTYSPYLENIAEYVSKNVPGTEILLQQTWAYEIDSLHPKFKLYDYDQHKMYEMLSEAYKKASAKINAKIIPCADAVQRLRSKPPFIYSQGGMSLCRDGFHMNVIYGRYLLAALWYEFLTGKSILENSYVPHTKLAPKAICRDDILQTVKETAHEIIAENTIL